MKPPPFEYHRPTTLDETLALLVRHGSDARLLAGGQSLLPMMKLRLARPAVLVDLNRVRELAYVRADDGALAFGAMARLSELESETIRARHPMLAAAAPHIGHRAIRHRGTICGSLAHADPAAELPVLALALDAELRVAGASGERTVAAQNFFVTYFTTSLGSGEVLREARFPLPPPGSGWSFMELARRHGDYALASVAALLDVSVDGTITRARVALGSVADRALRSPDAEATLVGHAGTPTVFEAAAAAAAARLDPPTDVHGSGAYRREIARVLVERSLLEAWSRAQHLTPSFGGAPMRPGGGVRYTPC
jgi:CO/xanthine dehydrogenase FAD-binding subunit